MHCSNLIAWRILFVFIKAHDFNVALWFQALLQFHGVKIKEINKLCADAVRGDSQITVLETWTLFADDKGDAKAEDGGVDVGVVG